MKSIRLLLLAAALCAAPLAAAQFAPILHKAPAPWRGYFDAVRQADAIATPLERCLSHPDFPGTAWPIGLAADYCKSLHGPSLTLADIDGYLVRAEHASLERAMRAELTAHFAAEHSEAIHRTLAAFASSPQAESISARWLQVAPDSPFALAARGQYLLNLKWERSGPAGADPAPLLERALDIEPRLVAAHAMLLELGMLNGNQAQVQGAWSRGQAADAGCRQLARVRMQSLRPRRSGSVEAMDAFAASLQPLASRRVLLHNVIAMASLERADSFLRAGQVAPAIEVLRRAARNSTYPDLWWRLARVLGEVEGTERHELIAVLVEGGRFVDDERAIAYERGRQLMLAGEGEWAVRSLKHALALEPGNLNTQQTLGVAYVQAGQLAQAERHFVAALEAPDLRALTLRALVASMVNSAYPERVARYAGMLTREQPESRHGWLVLGHARYKLQDFDAARSAYQRFLGIGTRTDPAWLAAVKIADQRLAEIKARPAP